MKLTDQLVCPIIKGSELWQWNMSLIYELICYITSLLANDIHNIPSNPLNAGDGHRLRGYFYQFHRQLIYEAGFLPKQLQHCKVITPSLPHPSLYIMMVQSVTNNQAEGAGNKKSIIPVRLRSLCLRRGFMLHESEGGWIRFHLLFWS